MAVRKDPQKAAKTLTVHLPDHDAKSAERLDHSGLDAILSAIIRDDRANASLADIVLKGGIIKAAGRDAGDVAWTKTVWRRSGPLLTDEPFVNPVDLKLSRQAKPR
ncbi:hypothetical protein [Sphingomonas sp.]|uniref:hypothetical protein n=1 Tax=Sphingomonas sp. TaxID=28214 RepID=UPI003B3A0832